MVKLTIKITNKTYSILEQMSKDSNIEINELVKLFIINRTEDYLEDNNLIYRSSFDVAEDGSLIMNDDLPEGSRI